MGALKVSFQSLSPNSLSLSLSINSIYTKIQNIFQYFKNIILEYKVMKANCLKVIKYNKMLLESEGCISKRFYAVVRSILND